ncbi:unnamed protein product [Effrenium voratum]|nr:unnamed protein product [Effrenium voratum]
MPRVLLEGCEAAQAAIQEVKAWEPLDLLSGAVHLSYLMLFSSLYAQLPGLHGPQGIDPHTVSRGLGQALVLTAAPGRAELGALLGLGASALAVAAPALRKGAPGLAISATQWVLWRDFMLAGDSAFPVGMTHLAMEGSIGAAAYSLEAYGLASWFWRWCLFRGLLAGGIHKALLCDQSWTDLSAVHWHFQGTPNPSSLGWLAFQLTSSFPWLGHLATASTLTIELAAPFLFFSPRLKYLGFAGNSALQLGILATGNYGPLNFYFLALGLSLLHQTRSELTANESRAVLPAAGLGLAVACYGMLRAPGACPSAYHAIYAQLATVFSSLAGLQGLLSMTSGVEKALGLGLLGLTSSVFTVDTLGYAAPHYELLQQSVLASSAWLQEKWEAFDIAFKKLVVQPAAYLADTLPPRVFDPPPNFFSNTTGVQGRPALALEGAESYFGPWRPVPMKYNDPSKPGLSSAPWPHAAFLDLLWWDAPHLGGSPMWLSRLLRGVMDGLQPVLDLIDRPAFEASCSAQASSRVAGRRAAMEPGDFHSRVAKILKDAERKLVEAHELEAQSGQAAQGDEATGSRMLDKVMAEYSYGYAGSGSVGSERPPMPECDSERDFDKAYQWQPPARSDSDLGAPRHFQLWSTYTKPPDFAMLLNDQESEDSLSAGLDEFAKELEAEKKNLSSKSSTWVLSPNSPKRICWDLAGVLVLLYDLIMIPMYTAFPLAPNVFLTFMTGVTLGFWTLDILACFCVGYYARDGTLVVSMSKIARAYLFSWFPLDCVIVSIDWVIVLALVAEEEGKSAGLMRAGKMLRALRVLRTLRLLRLAKLRQLLNKLQDQVDSEHISVILDIVKLLILIIFINHFIACAWYLVGCNAPALENSWLKVEFGTFDCEEENDELLLYKYTTSMHWSLTQFTPASMSVQPTNTTERSFAIGVLLFALLVFSSFVASLTGATTSLRKMTGRYTSQLWLLRKFLRQRQITLDLQVRINRYINMVISMTEQCVQYDDVKLFEQLSGPLVNELRTELNKPRLLVHPLFVMMIDRFEGMMRKVCVKVPVPVYLSRADILFAAGEECKSMYFLFSGSVDYLHHETKNFEHLNDNEWFCEVVLWTPWMHQGRVRAKIETEFMELNNEKFREVVSEYPKHLSFMRIYGLSFLHQMQELYIENERHLTDLDMQIAVSPVMTDLLQVELAEDDLPSVTSGASSFVHWPGKNSSPQIVSLPSQGPRYKRTKSKQLKSGCSESSLQEGKHNSPPTLEASESSLAQEANEPSVVVGLHSRVFEV